MPKSNALSALLKLEDLQPGDILCKYGISSFIHKIIKSGQSFTRLIRPKGEGNLNIHTALYMGEGSIAEFAGGGLHLNPIEPHIRYRVFRWKGGKKLPQQAGLVALALKWNKQAFDLATGYAAGKAAGSVFSQGIPKKEPGYLAKVLETNKLDLFCSEFVVLAYQLAASGSPSIGLVWNHTHRLGII